MHNTIARSKNKHSKSRNILIYWLFPIESEIVEPKVNPDDLIHFECFVIKKDNKRKNKLFVYLLPKQRLFLISVNAVLQK